ncbi:HRDC domain-containing protein [Jonesiaceae bacterium BS-20]|uniref:HRDC domain-containing protein n=1 Tax=Jonesiaceae bacterium BS-20 TaxID=3120821 RepID=A0AAU7E0W5_9MICO
MTTDSLETTPAADPDAHLIPIDSPTDGTPRVFTTAAEYALTLRSLSEGSGPIAIDAERASGFRYGQRNYLIQLRRAGSGTFLLDPTFLPDLSALTTGFADEEWVFHAAIQDLPSLKEQQILPGRIFDTELGSRILGLERVGLGPVVAEVLGYKLAKEHSAQDWSIRPLPEGWLNYAALDVEVLLPLRDAIAERLEDAGKLEWALQEFEATRTKDFTPKHQEPWRRISGLHGLKSRRELAIAKELWSVRDRLASHRDIAPGRVLPDRAILVAAKEKPRTIGELSHLHAFGSNGVKRRAAIWQKGIDTALALPADELPVYRVPKPDALPAPRLWPERNPKAAARLEASRAFYQQLSDEVTVPIENLLTPALLRKLCWEPPANLTPATVAQALGDLGARPWQVDLAVMGLTKIFKDNS